jgi:erythromycin esterase
MAAEVSGMQRKVSRLFLLFAVIGMGCTATHAFDQEAIAWIQQTAIALDTVEFVANHGDLMPLVPLLNDARIVALGEGTHGTREFFTARLRLMEFLASELGFTTFAFEFPYGEGVEINEYVQDGTGDPAEVLARVYCPPWNHAQMLELIEWMRTYNAAAGSAGAVSFHGVDIHDGSSTLIANSILRFIERADPARVAEFESALACFRYQSMYHLAAFADTDGACRENLQWVVSEITANRSRYAGTSSRQYETALHEARLLLQRAELYALATVNPGAANDYRDACMADNVAWLVESLGPSARVAISAHNYHVGRFKDHVQVVGIETLTQTAMGWHLSERYGDSYVVLAMTTRSGDVAIFPFPGSTVTDPTGRGLPQHEIVGLPRLRYGSVADLLRAADVSPCILDLRVEPETPGTDWLIEDRALLHFGTTFIPSIGSSYMIQEPIAELFDLLLYVEETTAPGMRSWIPWQELE